jgi:DNA-binding NarL/FixJ family response regulator
MEDELMRRVQRLTVRERRVFGLIGDGFTDTQLAKALGVTEKTALLHVKRLLQKMDVPDRDVLAALAKQLGDGAAGADACRTVGSVVDPGVWVNVFDAHPDPLMYVSCDYKILRVNGAQASLLGVRPSLCEGRRCYELLHGSDTPPEACPCDCVIREGMVKSADVDFATTGNCYRVTISPIRDHKGCVAGLLHTARRLTQASCQCSDVWMSDGDGTSLQDAKHLSETASRHLSDRLLSFVLRYLGQHARDATQRATLLTEFVSLLSEFGLSQVSLWEADSYSPRLVFRHSFEWERTPALNAPPPVCPYSGLFEAAQKDGFVTRCDNGIAHCAVAMSARLAGASTYVMLVECKEHAAGRAYLTRDQMQFMCDVLGEIVHHATSADEAPLAKDLTKRETAVMRLLEGDYLCKTIADQLGVSLYTVHVHIKNIYRKLQVHSREEAVRKWRAHRWNRCHLHGSAQAPQASPTDG